MRLLFIINPISGTARKDSLPRLIERTLDPERFSYDIAMTRYAGHAAELARQAVADGIDIVVAVGGDGTVNEVAREIRDTHTALGIIPCGSGNGLARHLMLPLTPSRAIDIINRCEIHELDYGLINNHPFFCTCGMGFDAYISQKFAEARNRGLATYIEKVLTEGIGYQPQTYSIDLTPSTPRPEENFQLSTFNFQLSRPFPAFLISCANASQYGNDAYIAPAASMRDGLLDVIIVKPFDLIDAPQLIMEMMNKTIDTSSGIYTFRTAELTISRARPDYIHYDGDPVMTDADVHIRLVHRGIRVIVNASADKRRRRPNALQTAMGNIFNDVRDIRAELLRRAPAIQDIRRFITGD